ncbi:SOSS complex subunit [Canna indica]|uniref:SOSS complex subunit n=1 Tax=Canna indica TaxID=4628 RepID=A0AAQ3JSA9_9LILI|nr:SOSS complex subunit [Canna indica]
MGRRRKEEKGWRQAEEWRWHGEKKKKKNDTGSERGNRIWGSKCEFFELDNIIHLSIAIFSYHKNSLVFDANKKDSAQKVDEFTMLFVDIPNMSEIN